MGQCITGPSYDTAFPAMVVNMEKNEEEREQGMRALSLWRQLHDGWWIDE